MKSLLELKMVGTGHGARPGCSMSSQPSQLQRNRVTWPRFRDARMHEGTWDACDQTHMHTYVEPLCLGNVLEAAHCHLPPIGGWSTDPKYMHLFPRSMIYCH